MTSQFKNNVFLFKDVSSATTSKTQCNSAQFSATTDGGTAPVICGTNTGYHSKIFVGLILDIIVRLFCFYTNST